MKKGQVSINGILVSKNQNYSKMTSWGVFQQYDEEKPIFNNR